MPLKYDLFQGNGLCTEPRRGPSLWCIWNIVHLSTWPSNKFLVRNGRHKSNPNVPSRLNFWPLNLNSATASVEGRRPRWPSVLQPRRFWIHFRPRLRKASQSLPCGPNARVKRGCRGIFRQDFALFVNYLTNWVICVILMRPNPEYVCPCANKRAWCVIMIRGYRWTRKQRIWHL